MRVRGLLLAALVAAAAVAAGVWFVLRSSDDGHPIMVGALEDSVKLPDASEADQRVALASGAGFNALNVTTAWEPGRTAPDPGELAILRNVAAAAQHRRIRLLISVYGGRPRDAPATSDQQDAYASFLVALARGLPKVRDFAVWNEPNLNGFWLDQFEGERDIAAPAYTALLARTYDALKAVSPKIRVYGGNLSPRGDDNPDAPRKTHSPTTFIRDMGAAYRQSGRSKPIMDVFAIHPYQKRSSIPPTRRHRTGTSIGIADYDKLVDLLGTAFDGTAQPGSKLPIAYTEFGVQSLIPKSAQAPYTNLGSPFAVDAVDEKTQGEYYKHALEMAVCQPTVIAVYIFHLTDETDLNRWQSGPYYAEGQPKSSLGVIREAAKKARKGDLGDCP